MRSVLLWTILLITGSGSLPLLALNGSIQQIQQREILHGPLRISAEETISRERGKIIEAKGKVAVKYEMKSGEVVESLSQFAFYNLEEGYGELWGKPEATWKQKSSEQSHPPHSPPASSTILKAEKITLKTKSSEILASGDVTVSQASSTLRAKEIRFFNLERKMTAEGGRPSFTMLGSEQRTKISAEKIVAWLDKKEILFNEKVQGTIEFSSQP